MLEVRHLCKTYRGKKGVETKALDDVSAVFPETGLVFLLGKSGSGKSTFLNLCGGLDKPDSGEIVIMGRSSAEFSAADFDSYRNTFVGFVFQEYNILNEFSVEDNIALALELQNKKRDPQKIAEILKSVDLEEFAARKPNTLSGGQKQRVAIARALVKEPRIIFADEPTGALDSATGKQVLDTLKKLAADKLVVVVSHDREFAEQYADRIIELKDGKIISDVSRTEATKDVNVRFVGQNTISVRDGSALTEEDFLSIRRFLSASKGGAVVSSEPQAVQETRRQEGGESTFERTAEPTRQPVYTEEEKRMIPSRLPFRHAFRMGAASIRLKPVRLAFTIFLSVVSFVVFGLFSTVMFYDAEAVTEEALKNSQIEYLNCQGAYAARQITWRTMNGEKKQDGPAVDTVMSAELSDEQYLSLNEKYPGSIAVFGGNEWIAGLTIEDDRFYCGFYQGFAYAKDDSGIEMLAGRLPENAGEAVISDYTFAGMRFGEFRDEAGEEIFLEGYGDYEKIPVQNICDTRVKIVGVYAAEPVPERFDELRSACDDHRYTEDNGSIWWIERDSGFYSYLLVDEAFLPVYRDYSERLSANGSLRSDDYFAGSDIEGSLYYDCQSGEEMYGESVDEFNRYDGVNEFELLPLYDPAGKERVTEIGNGEIAVSVSVYGEIMGRGYLDDAVQTRVYELENSSEEADWSAAWELDNEYRYGGIAEDLITLEYEYFSTDEEALACLSRMDAFMRKWEIPAPQFSLSNSTYFLEEEVVLAGVILEKNMGSAAYLGPDLYEKFYKNDRGIVRYTYETRYVPDEGAFLSGVFIPRTQYEKGIRALVSASFDVREDDSMIVFINEEMQQVAAVHSSVLVFRTLTLLVWLGFTLFAVLLMFNFISASITAKKKEIGILRAIGARGTDVFKVFWSEALVVGAICFVLSAIACAVLCPVISGVIIENTTLQVSILIFTPLTVLFMAAVALITCTLSTILPVAVYCKKPPVESIRAL